MGNAKKKLSTLTPRKGGRLTKVRQKEVYETMAELHEEGRLGKNTLRDLAAMFNINKNTAMTYRNKVLMDCEPYDTTALQNRSYKMMDRIERNAHQLMDEAEATQNPRDKLILMERVPKFYNEFTKYLEMWGTKEQISQKLEIDAHIKEERISININLPALPNGN